MAAVADVQLVNITINDLPLQVPKGEMIVESAKRLGLDIPIFCYHPRMKPVGMCRMCLIEIGFKQPDGSVRKMPKPQTACTLPASEGLAVYTESDSLRTDRKGVLEFLLVNHPLDCPICDRGGECPLQNNTLFYGPSTSRFVEMKRHAPKAFPLSKYVTLDLERCIQCGRCVRFTEEISGDAQLAFRFRGAQMQPSTFELSNFGSKFSGNVIEVCPVGALTSSKYRFRARPWDLQTKPGLCTRCSNGCNVYVDYRNGEIVRINGRTNEAVNEEWTCDRGKFGHDAFNSKQRLKTPMVRVDDRLHTASWSEAYRQILDVIRAVPAHQIAALGGAHNSNEDLFALRSLFRETLGIDNLDHRFERRLQNGTEQLAAKTGVKLVQNTLPSFEAAKSILVFGASLSDELPILFLRVRKAWFNRGAKVVVAHDRATDADSFANVILRYKPGTAETLAKGLRVAAGAAEPSLAAFTPEFVEEITGVPAARLREAAAVLSGSAIVLSRGIYDVPGGAEAAEALAALSTEVSGTFNLYARQANEEGAARIGIAPQTLEGLDSHQIVQGCLSGRIRALWLVGFDPFAEYPDRELAKSALENVEFLVYQNHTETEAMHFASVVLPMTAPTEAEGTYTNFEGRVQHFPQVLPPKGEAKSAWKVFSELSLRLNPAAPPVNAGDLFLRIAASVPAFAGLSYSQLGAEGHLLPG